MHDQENTDGDTGADVDRYLYLTKTEMPRLARSTKRHWPVREDHCFQRIVLDTVCEGRWYDHIARPAYKNLTADQARAAVALCNAIIRGDADLNTLNEKSLNWRGKLKTRTG